MVIAVFFGIFLGVLSAVHRNCWIDHICRVISMVGVSIPSSGPAWCASFFFTKYFPFPASGRLDTFLTPPPAVTGLYVIDGILSGNMDVVISAIHHLLLPALCLAYAQLAIIARQVRSGMVDVLEQDYIRTARACGIPRRRVIYRYALKMH